MSSNDTNIETIEVEDDNGLQALKENADHFFLAMMGIIILFMQAGFGFLEAGSVRAKNTTNILIKNYADLCAGGLSFWILGYSFAFGKTTSFIGLDNFVLIGLPLSSYTHFFFQCTFATTCATIVSGAVAERCSFNGYTLFSIVITGVFYPISTHWCWSETGWLAAQGFSDFAGSAVVHLAGGVCALTGAIILGPRLDRFRDPDSLYIMGHNIPHISLGGFILVSGFMAFNGGSQASISQKEDGDAIGTAIVSTLIACAVSGIVVLAVWKFNPGGDRVWSLTKIVNGCLAGMVSVCAACNLYYPWAAAIVGSIAGFIYLAVSATMVRLRIDDPLDAVAVHAGAGLWGIIAGPVFKSDGILATGSDEAFQTLIWNAIGAAVIIAWHGVLSLILFYTLDRMGIFRVSAKYEILGLDVHVHKEPAYLYDPPNDDQSRQNLKQMQQMMSMVNNSGSYNKKNGQAQNVGSKVANEVMQMAVPVVAPYDQYQIMKDKTAKVTFNQKVVPISYTTHM